MEVGDYMQSCQLCSGSIPLNDSGTLVVTATDKEIIPELWKSLQQTTPQAEHTEGTISISYSSWNELLATVTAVTDSPLQKKSVYGSLVPQTMESFQSRVDYPISQLQKQIEHPNYVKIIQEQIFQSAMQPILSTTTSEIYGYEFLLRAKDDKYPFYPGELFDFSQESGLQSLLDSQARIASIRTSSKLLPKGIKRFINFLPSSIYDPAHCLKSTFRAIEKYQVDPADLVFEVVETEKIQDIKHLQYIFDEYKKAGVSVALDDIGSGYATIDVLKQLKPNVAKIDRELVKDCHKDSSKLDRIKLYRDITHEFGATLLAEGIETPEEYEAVRGYVDFVQGYYFGKPMMKPL
ncbi:EAL domain-containing protein [Paenalkalicoccus suaedae]|nr:EAL domain-containing protein [Paenalkalicoccus suaedae]